MVCQFRRNIPGLPENVEETQRSVTQYDSVASSCPSGATNTSPFSSVSVWTFLSQQHFIFKFHCFSAKAVTFPYPHIMKSMYQEMSLFGNKLHFDLKKNVGHDVFEFEISGLQPYEQKNSIFIYKIINTPCDLSSQSMHQLIKDFVRISQPVMRVAMKALFGCFFFFWSKNTPQNTVL